MNIPSTLQCALVPVGIIHVDGRAYGQRTSSTRTEYNVVLIMDGTTSAILATGTGREAAEKAVTRIEKLLAGLKDMRDKL